MLAGAAGLFLGTSAFFPRLVIWPLKKLGFDRLWQRLITRDAEVRGGLEERVFLGLAIATAMWGGVCFAANVFGNALAPPPVQLDDQGAYLQTARDVERDEGPLHTLPHFFSALREGHYREANRHPLFIAALSIRATEAWGRTLAWWFGISAFVTGVWMVWRRFSPLTAGIFAILLGMNFNLGQYSVMIVCESLLIGLVGMAYFAILPSPTASRTLGRRRMRILVASTLLGLAYMTKGTGLVFFGVFIVWLAWVCRSRSDNEVPPEIEHNAMISLVEAYPLRQWAIAMICGLIGFIVVSAPLIERNIRVYGNPFYNVNSLLLFTDDYSQFDNLLKGGVAPNEAAEVYFRTHTIWDMIDREARGLVWESFIMLRALGPQGLDDGRVIFGLPIAICAGIGLWFERRPAKWLLVWWIAVSWVMFAWYVPIAAGDRFPIPLLMPVLAFAAEGMRRLLMARLTPGNLPAENAV